MSLSAWCNWLVARGLKTPAAQHEVFRGRASHHRLGEFLVPCPEVMKQFGCHTHFKIWLEVPHPTETFSLRIWMN